MENGLRRLDGVDRVLVDVQDNVVTIVPSARIAPDLAAIPAAVRDAGFRPGRMWLRAEGATTALPDDTPGFRIAGWPAPLPLAGPAAAAAELQAEVLWRDGPLRLQVVRP